MAKQNSVDRVLRSARQRTYNKAIKSAVATRMKKVSTCPTLIDARAYRCVSELRRGRVVWFFSEPITANAVDSTSVMCRGVVTCSSDD